MDADDVLEEFGALPLHVRMKTAAAVLREAGDRIGMAERERYRSLWSATALVKMANRWLAEDAEKAAAEAEVEELAETIWNTSSGRCDWPSTSHVTREMYRGRARAILAAGYRKQADGAEAVD